MEVAPAILSKQSKLPLILAAAVVQGWALYALHYSIEHHIWPATVPGWLTGLYSVVVIIPVTLELLAPYGRRAAMWSILAVMALAWFYWGWNYGNSVISEPSERAENYFSVAFVLIVLWLYVLPFAQNRLAAGRWNSDYRHLFENSWRNALTLAEAALFTGLLWLVLALWQELFHMLKIDFFRDLFGEPIFIYPITSIVFGCAVHLVGSIDLLISTVLEQLLNVLKWLAIVVGLLLGLFTVALVIALPHLVFTGENGVSSTWLLWLTAVVVLVLNAAFRDGTIEYPYPKWIALTLRILIPLTVVVSCTAVYALLLRVSHFGLSVERVWGFVVAAAAFMYSAGYSIAALRRGRWLAGIAPVNVVVALTLIVVIAAALTPALSPYRLAADSQFDRIRENRFQSPTGTPLRAESIGRFDAFRYLRFEAGKYGKERLLELSKLEGVPRAERIRSLAVAALKETNPWIVSPQLDVEDSIAKLALFPAGRTLSPELKSKVAADAKEARYAADFAPSIDCTGKNSHGPAGIFIDLNGDGKEEFILVGAYGGLLYQEENQVWRLMGRFHEYSSGCDRDRIMDDLAAGNFGADNPRWKELRIGKHKYKINELLPAD